MKRLIKGLMVIAAAAMGCCVVMRADASKISEKELRKTVVDLAAYGTRYAKSGEAREAADYLRRRLKRAGYRVEYQRFMDNGTELLNVEGVRKGKRDGKVIVLGAHYDSYNEEISKDKGAPAPGADDNGSGVAAVLAAAEKLAREDMESELRVVFFTAEETGLKGSKRYVEERVKGEKRKVVAVVADYIGSPTEGGEDRTVIMYDRKSKGMVEVMEGVGKRELPGLSVGLMRSEFFKSYGDYKAFWEAGREAVMVVREYNFTTENRMHTRNDLPEGINFRQVARVAELIELSVKAMDERD